VVPAEFKDFFLASAGAAAALIGLLFVAVSVAPERTVTPSAPMERKAVAASVFGALLNAFFISLAALLPLVNLGWVALVMALIGIATSLNIGWPLLRGRGGWRGALRRTFLIIIGLLIYGYQLASALPLLRDPADLGALYVLSWLIIAVFGIGIVRAWELLGAQRFGLLARLSPLRDMGEEGPTRRAQPSPAPHPPGPAKRK
jgi:hypothetical protein